MTQQKGCYYIAFVQFVTFAPQAKKKGIFIKLPSPVQNFENP